MSKLVDILINKIPEKDYFLFKIKEFDEDIFGIYRISNNMQFIVEIYWTVISVVSTRYNIQIEPLTLVILSHEYAHAYSHLGCDANGSNWNTNYFFKTDVLVKEGLAEYFSYKFMESYNNPNNNFIDTYKKVLDISPEIYKEYLNWCNPLPEAVRFAMLNIRHNRVKKPNYGNFLEYLESGKLLFNKNRDEERNR